MFSSRLINLSLRAARVRGYATNPKPGGFFSKIVENLRSELSNNKEMKDNIAKFREEAQRLEQTEALKQARRKFEIVESEATESSKILKEKIGSVTTKIGESIKESDFAKKESEVGGQLGKQAQEVADSVADTGAKIVSTAPFRAMSDAAAVVKEELVETSFADTIYRKPIKLRKRQECPENSEEQVITPNKTATAIDVHPDSKLFQSWENFKDKNPYVNKVLDWKIKYDESDNAVIKASRLLTNKRNPRMTRNQKDGLLRLVEDFFIRKTGNCINVNEKDIDSDTWNSFADELNKLGPSKDVENWKSALYYMKLRVKAKLDAVVKKCMQEKQPLNLNEHLNEADQKIVSMFYTTTLIIARTTEKTSHGLQTGAAGDGAIDQNEKSLNDFVDTPMFDTTISNVEEFVYDNITANDVQNEKTQHRFSLV